MKKKTVLAIVIPVAVAASTYAAVKIVQKQHDKKNYLCPSCGEVFKPGIVEFAFGKNKHNRKQLVCPVCGQKGYCSETLLYNDEYERKTVRRDKKLRTV